jgi:DNA polymerase III epsilon subunit-like protein
MNPNLVTMNDNVLAAMDVETTGREPGRHEVCQIGIVTLDCHLNPVDHFYTNVCPQYPDRIHPEAVATHGLTWEVLREAPDKFTACDSLWDWFQSLELVPGKRLIPLCHNCQFDIPFVQFMLGFDAFYEIFAYPTRDTQAIITGIMDKGAYNGTHTKFTRASLGNACEVLGIDLPDHHDALADAIATAKVYQKLMQLPSW